MYPLTRLVGTFVKAKRGSTPDAKAISEIKFRCRPWDLDMFLEMNNGRVLTLYDLGRFDLLLCMGLDKIMRKNHWGLVAASSTVRYRHRIRMFDKVSIRTQVAGVDERWVYIAQSMWVRGLPASAVLIRTGITSKGKVISPQHLLDELGVEMSAMQLADWDKQWVETENARPWPPQL
ncbi:MAG: acyl-CoA thioesterase [Granulosicoccaceae bacterium]